MENKFVFDESLMEDVLFLQEALSVLIESANQLNYSLNSYRNGYRVEYSSEKAFPYLKIDENNTITRDMIAGWWSKYRQKYQAKKTMRETERLSERYTAINRLSPEEAKILGISDGEFASAKMFVEGSKGK